MVELECWDESADIWSTGVTGRGTILIAVRHMLTGDADLPAKCCVKHFSAICKPAWMKEKSANDSSNSSHWRPESMSNYRQSPKVQIRWLAKKSMYLEDALVR